LAGAKLVPQLGEPREPREPRDPRKPREPNRIESKTTAKTVAHIKRF